MYLYDELPWNRRLLLDLQMREETGLVAYDHSKSHHVATLHGTPAWSLSLDDVNYLDFEATNPDWLDIPAASTVDLDFTAGDFSLAAWVRYESVGFRYLMVRGLTDTDGWEWAIDTDSALWFRTNQALAHQDSISLIGVVPIGVWTFLAVARDGASALPYVNGLLRAGTAGVHVNPLTANRELHIGINDAEAAGFFDGGMWRPRIWSRALTAPECLAIFNAERSILGV